jgi:hypothetical protein
MSSSPSSSTPLFAWSFDDVAAFLSGFGAAYQQYIQLFDDWGAEGRTFYTAVHKQQGSDMTVTMTDWDGLLKWIGVVDEEHRAVLANALHTRWLQDPSAPSMDAIR